LEKIRISKSADISITSPFHDDTVTEANRDYNKVTTSRRFCRLQML